MRLGIGGTLLLASLAVVALVVAGPGAAASEEADLPDHKVIVGVPDTGINPYHEAFYRPGLTEHPSTYIDGYPEEAQKLELSIETAREEGFVSALVADRDTWDGLDANTLYWIPNTSIVAALCMPEAQRGGFSTAGSSTCILDDESEHGTGTAGSVVTANPDALVAFKQGGPGLASLLERGVPIDVASVSWGNAVPVPLPRGIPDVPLYLNAAGNDPRPTVVDGWAGHPRVIAVGGAYAGSNQATGQSSEPLAANTPDIVSSYCWRVPTSDSTSRYRRACGTSFASPNAAGALSKAILEVREASGYTGQAVGEVLDPELGIEADDVREALNRTATYDPFPRGNDAATVRAPVVEPAPWLQWGWGFYDAALAYRTVVELLGPGSYEKPLAAHAWMETVYEARGVWGQS